MPTFNIHPPTKNPSQLSPNLNIPLPVTLSPSNIMHELPDYLSFLYYFDCALPVLHIHQLMFFSRVPPEYKPINVQCSI